MKIILPWPDAKLNPNSSKGRHWSSTSALRSKAKTDAFYVTKTCMAIQSTEFAPEGPQSLSITFVQPDRRARDRDNLLAALKPAIDGIASALGIDDSQFDPITIRRDYGPKPGSVIVEIA